VARRHPGWGGLLASLPLTSLMAMIWLWRDTGDEQQVAALSINIFWFFIPSVPMFLLIPALLRSGMPYWPTMGVAVMTTLALYALAFWAGPRLGLRF
jgi:hypothetical protein